MIYVNYTTEGKTKSEHNDGYVEDATQIYSDVNCHGCIFVGENEHLSKRRLCGKYIREVAEVQGNGSCRKARAYWHWYNQINPFKKWLLERSGFKFKNR